MTKVVMKRTMKSEDLDKVIRELQDPNFEQKDFVIDYESAIRFLLLENEGVLKQAKSIARLLKLIVDQRENQVKSIARSELRGALEDAFLLGENPAAQIYTFEIKVTRSFLNLIGYKLPE